MILNEKLEEFENWIIDKKVAVIGLGVSNLPLLDYLYEKKAIISVFDDRTREELDKEAVEKIDKYYLEAFLGEDNLKNLVGFDLIFRSPSCMPFKPELEEEKKRGAILTTEIEMVLRLSPSQVIGITGSDGKTTTTSLVYAILKEAGFNCFLGGNIGIPLFTKIKDMQEQDKVVLELSSFQLMDMNISPSISIVTNVSPNHLNIHRSYEEYIDAKANIFKSQDKNGIVVLNEDNDITRGFKDKAKGKVVLFSRKEKLKNGVIYDDEDKNIKIIEDGEETIVINTKDVILRGLHNYENICAAVAACKSIVDIDVIKEAIKKFKPVEHRLEFVREIDGVKWYNDSIGSSPSRTIAGINSYDENIVLIAGGYDKNLDYKPLAKPVIEKVETLVLMGQTADKIEKAVREEGKDKKLPNIIHASSLEDAVNKARENAKPGNVVLFSPAAASFDLFKNFMERGNKFKEIVNNLK